MSGVDDAGEWYATGMADDKEASATGVSNVINKG